MAVSTPLGDTVSLGFIGENGAEDIFIESDEAADVSQATDLSTGNAEDATSDLISLFPSRANRSGLLREQDEHDDLWQRLNELDRFCGLYLEQQLQDCVDEKDELALTKHLEHHQKLRVTTEMALTQLPKVAHMQAEVEYHMWTIPSLPVAKLLKLSPKPRTFISVSTLNRFSLYQLQLLMNDLHASIHSLNSDLLQHLTERDELHSELGRKCAEVGHLATYFKDLCVGLSVSRLRRQLSNPVENHTPDIPYPFARVAVRLTTTDNTGTASKSRLFRSLFSRRSTKF